MTVKIDFVLTGTTQLVPYYQFELTNVLISGFSMDSSGNRPIEMLSLNFTKVQFTDFEVTDKNDPGAPFRTGYDLELAQAI
jgi:type VI secretion system secreted protein Hcp